MASPPVSTRKAPIITLNLDNGLKLKKFNAFTITNAIDSAADAFSFSFPYDGGPLERQALRPFAPGVMRIQGEDPQTGTPTPLLLGYFERVNFDFSAGSRMGKVEGRSASGGLVDWSAGSLWDRASQAFHPTYKFQFLGRTANQICQELAAAHLVRFTPDTPPINELAITPGQTIWEVLSKLAASNGYFGVPGRDGSIEFRADLGKTRPVADIVEGQSPGLTISTRHDVTKRYHKYVVITNDTGEPNITRSVIDSQLAPAIRGVKIIQPEQQSTDYDKTARMSRSRSLIDAYTVVVTLSGFAYNTGAGGWEFYRAGDVITLLSPSAYVLKKTKYIIQRVSYTLSDAGQQSALDLALPELYSGGIPSAARLPWGA